MMSSLTFHCQVTTIVTDKVKSLLSHVHSGNALSPQLRVNRGELSPKCVIVDPVEASIVPHSELFFKMLLGYLVFGLLGKKR